VFNGGNFPGTAQAPDHDPEGFRIGLRTLSCQQDIMVKQTRQRGQEGFGKIVYRGLYVFYAFVGKLLPRLTHGKKMERETKIFQQVNLIGYEGLTDTGIAFEYIAYYSLSAFSQFSLSLR
jgi:hypothetical protein